MPRAVVDAGLATAVRPLERLGTTVPTLCRSVPKPSEPFEAPEWVEIPEQVVREPLSMTPYF
jgi:hypothetical protein